MAAGVVVQNWFVSPNAGLSERPVIRLVLLGAWTLLGMLASV